MNTIRTSEKSIRLLRGICKPRVQRPIHTKTLNVYLGKPVFNHRGIKLQNVSKRLSTEIKQSAYTELPLINPSKPSSKSLLDLSLNPIVPLSLSKFPKGTSHIVPSVTKILGATMPASSQFVLDRWKEAMIKKLGVAGFNKYQAETFERGRALHALIAKHLMGQGDPRDELSKEVVAKLWKSIENVVREKIRNVRLVEHIVTHPAMNYRGIIDCVASYNDELVVIDFKTAEKPKKSVDSLYDNPLQVTAYCGALNNDANIPLNVIDRNITSGLIIVAYMDGSEASVHHLNSEQIDNFWKKWVIRLNQFQRMDEMRQQTQTPRVTIT